MTNQLRLFVLFVVISGALCTVEDYVIMSQCAHNKAINLAAEGTVSVTDISQTQNITIVGRPDFVNNNFKIALYAKETQRYLCFNDHWKLVGMKELQDTCYFNEAIVHGYFVFRSVVDLQRRIGFTQRGRAVGPKKTVNDACYMFTKIPTDQFFHQHTHFSAPKTKSTTTKKPKTDYTHAPYATHMGRGSGGGRTKTNHFKTQHRKDDAVTPNHSGSGHGNGSGSGNGSGNGNGSGKKKFRKQRNGNKEQQKKQEMQQQIRGHSYKLNNPKNSTYLNSSRQNLVLSQHSINNHTNKQHNNNSNNNNNNNDTNNNNNPPQNHQVRHHHNDPNKVARRHQHDQKQKTKKRPRVRPSPSSYYSNVATLTTTTATNALTTPKAINSNKPHASLTSSYSEINATSVIPTISTDATSDSRNTMSSTVVVTKRKGRRRKGQKLHKKVLPQQNGPTMEYFREQMERDQSNNSTLGAAYDEEEDYMTSSTDYTWMTNDIMLSSIKPTSASLPSWETWYPSSSSSSSSTSYTDEDSDYFLSSSVSSVTETNANRKSSLTLEASSMSDFDKNTLSSQTFVPLPTPALSTTLTAANSMEFVSPTITTDLGMTTTNTSTYTPNDFWSSSPHDHTDVNTATKGFAGELFNTYATPELEYTRNIPNTDEVLHEDLNSLSTTNDSENSTAALPFPSTTIEADENDGNNFSSSSTDATADGTTSFDGSMAEITSSRDYDQNRAAAATTTTTFTNTCTYNGSKPMTDCMLATKTTATVANNHKYKTEETSPTSQHATQNHTFFKKVIAKGATTHSSTLKTESKSNEQKSSSAKPTTTRAISPTLSLPQASATLAVKTSRQHLNPIEKSLGTNVTGQNTGNHNAVTRSSTATAFSPTVLSTKSTLAASSSPLTTRKTLRKSTQRLLATPFHQLTYVRNKAGDIDIDSIDNISIYPDLLDNDNDEPLVKHSTSRLTMISGYLPTSATATLPESIRIAKIKINRERKRMLRLRNIGNYA